MEIYIFSYFIEENDSFCVGEIAEIIRNENLQNVIRKTCEHFYVSREEARFGILY